MHVRLAGEQRDLEASRHRHRLGGLLRRQAGELVDVRLRRSRSAAAGSFGFSAWKRKSSKLTWPQWPVCLSTRRMKISLPWCGLQIDDDAAQVLLFQPGGAVEDLAVVLADQLDAGRRRCGPPPTRNDAHGCVTLNGTLT